jgi:DNA-binding MarR family transcriptional regulator
MREGQSQTDALTERAVTAFFQASALLDPIRLKIWDEDGLTVTQLRLLTFLETEEGVGNAELADKLFVTRPSVSALLDRLERGGFLRREISLSDRRGIRIWLEPRGRDAVAHLRGETREYARRLMDNMTVEEKKAFAGAVECMVASGRQRRARDLALEAAASQC